jgi:Arc/MetJ family transcription regulator
MSTRTNIVLDDELVAKAMARAGVKTKKAAVEAALRAFVRKPDYSGLLALAGTGVIAEGYDPKAAAPSAYGSSALLASEPAPAYGKTPSPARRRAPARK